MSKVYTTVAPRIFSFLKIKNGTPIAFIYHYIRAHLYYLFLKDKSWNHVKVHFLISTGRTGTHFITHFINSFVPDCLALHEPKMDLNYLNTLYSEGRISKRAAKVLLLYLRRDVYQQIKVSGKGSYLECNLYAALITDVLLDTFDQCKIIYLYRDGRDVVRSFYSHKVRGKWVNETYFYANNDPKYRIKPTKAGREGMNWNEMSRFEKLTWYWSAYNDQILNNLKQNGGQVLKLRFEDILKKKDNEALVKMIHFIDKDLDLDLDALQTYLEERKSNQKTSYELKKWQHWDESDTDRFNEIAGHTMQKLGYYKDAALR